MKSSDILLDFTSTHLIAPPELWIVPTMVPTSKCNGRADSPKRRQEVIPSHPAQEIDVCFEVYALLLKGTKLAGDGAQIVPYYRP